MTNPTQYLQQWLNQLEALEQGDSHRLTLQYKVPTLNTWLKLHFKRKRQIRNEIAWEIAAQCKPKHTFKMATLLIERYSNHHQSPDWDNLIGGMKPVIDCLVVPSKRNPAGLGFIEDDNTSCLPIQPIVMPVFVPEKSLEKTVITITELK